MFIPPAVDNKPLSIDKKRALSIAAIKHISELKLLHKSSTIVE